MSPSLFSLHSEGEGIERATSLSDGFGFAKGREHEEWLNFVMEAAGVSDVVQYLKVGEDGREEEWMGMKSYCRMKS